LPRREGPVMSALNLGFLDYYPKLAHEQRLREAEMQRLAALAAGPRRPLRSVIANLLVALANRIDERPHRAIASAQA
jgi:hypothetical protein